jgi:glycosyltransferase involved in cell wall biosynthesis
MPTVVAEAMMHCVPCILSDATGTSGYIEDNRNGIIFESGNVNQLSEKIMWCVDHKNELPMMGEAARKVYETHFSESAIEKKISGIINDML